MRVYRIDRIERGDVSAGRVEYTTEEMVAAIREADAVNSRPFLRHEDYRRYADRHRGLPSVSAICNRFAGRWSDACRAAGVPSDPKVRLAARRVDYVSVEECLDAVRRCQAELGLDRVPTVTDYDAWSRGRLDAPSNATVRKRCGGWRGVLRALGA